jgi:hypothetical protein
VSRLARIARRLRRPAVVNHITVHVHAPGADSREIGRQVVEAIKKYQQGGGKI